ncbi:MAG: hypothetical protein C5B55_00590 [Blastocatellia bacterium]|nr:MAG: hypothetical protein C5B55_00590 [Blastocatellia bacterium]
MQVIGFHTNSCSVVAPSNKIAYKSEQIAGAAAHYGLKMWFVNRSWGDVKAVLDRATKLRCPACGKDSILDGPFKIKHHCSSCSAHFKREEGFFVGAILVNVVITELVILLVCFFSLLVLSADYSKVLYVLFAIAVIFPVGFYHHSWSLWLGFDHFVESLPYRTKKVE